MMIQSDEKYFIDTNVLVYSSIKDINYKGEIKNTEILNKMKDISIKLMNEKIGEYYFSNQIMNEYYAIMTNNKLFDKPLLKNEVIQNINNFLIKFNIINAPCYDLTFGDDISKYDLNSKRIFDYHIYYTMIKNSINKIITFDEDHFKIFNGIDTYNPLYEKNK